ncbi:hypothetical protein Patl1_04966 [Pistacia atlantica]|uniref:Uncharacterized protein n=1 Tax=Pistacia atlantica TaxID=434234 RepID=A0ACC1BRN4_9ROSI|nr:hypothetical protein Patl1_04966 [Pistacia atlantica]
MELWRICRLFLLAALVSGICILGCEGEDSDYMSALGDPGMKRDSLRVAIESWNQCNEVGEEAPNSGRIKTKSVDRYAAKKEIYLGNKCQVDDRPRPWQFWMVMLKSGNTDTYASRCPKNGERYGPFPMESRFPCFGDGCMNMPLMYHNYTSLEGDNNSSLKGSFYGTWDLDANVTDGVLPGNGTSYYSVTWEKDIGKGSWIYHHLLKTSPKYPWLMLYLRADATTGILWRLPLPDQGNAENSKIP